MNMWKPYNFVLFFFQPTDSFAKCKWNGVTYIIYVYAI